MKRIQIGAVDLMILLYNLCQCMRKLHEWNDAEQSLSQVIFEADRWFPIRQDTIESLLYAANMMHERNMFWHPRDKDFKLWLGQVKEKYEWNDFDLQYNFFKEGKK